MRRHNREYMRRVRQIPEGAERVRQRQREDHTRLVADPIWMENNRRKRAAYYQSVKDRPRDKYVHRAATNRHRSRKYAASLTPVTQQDWLNILNAYAHRCAYCSVGGVRLEQEHVIPLSMGGEHSAENIVPACRACNARKGQRTPDQAGMRIVDVVQVEQRYPDMTT